ncbi:molybdopterin molybdotransferase MoeA [Halomonas sp. QX-2]|jgi:molybdopterin molybdotransferase|uniref:Molybdopterin molybdenumtransferase n=1 Tax=Vreelandella sedimenti TaxID=2729618 RepID=A0A7Z0SLP4_9GAMM|nr:MULTISPECIES: gephyrin-like molybdotransferase Glp [Halomonas]NYT72727.1 molybdopterin molybdotransferase MoeA [Halomonas sedimenti]|tara:strand:- start:43516 stop:44778 length:1263 start_codon:yes stop_codon:yes gene_type:complete
MNCQCGEIVTPGLLDVFDARQWLIDAAMPLDAVEEVTLEQAAGRVLAETVVAPLDMPGVDNSAMDGYALRLADYQATPGGEGLPVLQRVPAGAGVLLLPQGGCARIFTGAPVPMGADIVVPQERVTLNQRGHIHLKGGLVVGANIRRQGEETRIGTSLLAAGTFLDAASIALLASHGINAVTVKRRLRVALLSTGDELIAPGTVRSPGQVYDSNRAMLNVLLAQAQCDVLDLGVIADSPQSLHQAFEHAQTVADVVMCTGGVSVGEEDHVRPVIEQRGGLHFHGVAMKPGKPFAFGYLGAELSSSTPLIALPGNPVASLVGWQLLALPFIHAMQGRDVAALQRYPVKAGFSQRGPQGRCELLRVVLDWSQRVPVAQLAGGQGSHMLSAASQAHGYLMINPATQVTEGSSYHYYPLNQFAA